MAKKAKAKKKGGFKKKSGKKGDLMGTAKVTGMEILAISGGVLAAQKFADFKEVFKDQYAKDPQGMMFKHEGLIKVAAAIFAYHNSKNAPEIVRQLIIGLGIQGAILAIREFTKDPKTGESMFKTIGQTDYDEAINALAAEVKSVAEVDRTGVGSGEDEINMHGPDQSFDSQTGVGNVYGMGMDNEDND